jgi:serine protease Do
VAPDLVVTNAHVLCPGGEAIEVTLSNERKLIGQVVRSDEDVDLGLVRVTGAGATPLPLGDVADLAVGDKVMIIGSPVGLDFTVQEGSISSLQRSAFGVALVQLDA